MQANCGQDNLELHYIDTDCFIFSLKPIESLFEDLNIFEEEFDFSDLDPSQELFSKNIRNTVKIEFGNSSKKN